MISSLVNGEHYEMLGAWIGQRAAIEMVIAALGRTEDKLMQMSDLPRAQGLSHA